MEDFKNFDELDIHEDAFLENLEPYDINDQPNNIKQELGEDNIDSSINRDTNYKDPFFRIYSRYFIKPNKDKSQACKVEIYLQHNKDRFFSKGLVIVPIIKFHFGKFKEMINEINPSFIWDDNNVYWLYGWDRVDKFFNILKESLKIDGEIKEQISNLNEKVKKSLDLYKPDKSPVLVMSLNRISDKQVTRFSLSPDSIKELLTVRNLISQIIPVFLAYKFSHIRNGK